MTTDDKTSRPRRGAPGTPAAGGARNPKSRVGVVVSDKMQKTVVVQIERLVVTPMYKKRVRRSFNIKAHDERQEAKPGDRVEIVETRPLSKDKRWRVRRVLEKAKLA